MLQITHKIRRKLVALWLVLALSSGPLAAQTITVTSSDELSRLARELRGGETILLQPGIYESFSVRGGDANPAFSKPVTIKSANPSKQATLKNVSLVRTGNLHFENLHFKYDYEPGRGVREPRPFYFQQVRDISVEGSIFEGDIATGGGPLVKGFAIGKGLVVRGGRNIRVEENEFFHWFAGAAFHHIDGLVFRANEVHSIRSDGVNCSEMRSALIANNYIHDFRPSTRSKDHRDMIQCWSTNTSRYMDGLTIEGNILNSGTGAFTQSIFLRNEVVDKKERGNSFFYRNLTIRNNVVINAHRHGLFIGQTDGLVVENNTIVRTRRGAGRRNEPKIYIPAMTIRPDSRNVVVRGNIVSEIEGYGRQPDWQVAQNLFVQDEFPFRPNHYDSIFVSPPGSNIAKVGDFKLRKDGKLAGQAIGAPALRR